MSVFRVPSATEPRSSTDRLSGEFRDPEVERHYRQEMIDAAAGTYSKLAVGITGAILCYSLLDLASLGFSPEWALLLLMRVGAATTALLVAWRLKVAQRSFVDGSGLWFLALGEVAIFAMLLAVCFVRTDDAVTNTLSTVIVMLTVLISAPGRFHTQILLSASLLTGLVIVSLTRWNQATIPLAPLIANLLAALALGAVILVLFNRRQRAQWWATRHERRTSGRLEAELVVASELRAELQELALRDPLTHAANRREFLRVASGLLSPGRAGAPLSLVMMDIDRFKAVNDRFGHGTGDAVLVDLVRKIDGEVRDDDLVARLGGEEFAVLLPGIDRDGAGSIAERIRSAIATSSSPIGSRVPVTVSIGVAIARPTDSVDALLARADECMYVAKREGGDAVCVDPVDDLRDRPDADESADLASALVEVDDQ